MQWRAEGQHRATQGRQNRKAWQPTRLTFHQLMKWFYESFFHKSCFYKPCFHKSCFTNLLFTNLVFTNLVFMNPFFTLSILVYYWFFHEMFWLLWWNNWLDCNCFLYLDSQTIICFKEIETSRKFDEQITHLTVWYVYLQLSNTNPFF